MKYILIAVVLLFINTIVYAQPTIGSKAPEISLPNESGEIVKLSSLKGKVVLIDFWASWCQPCRKSNRNMQPIYKKYKDKGLEVFGVSIDNSRKAWSAAVKQDNIPWIQVIDTKAATGNDLIKTWNIQYIPSTFLLDKEGRVIAVAPETNELESLLNKLLPGTEG